MLGWSYKFLPSLKQSSTVLLQHIFNHFLTFHITICLILDKIFYPTCLWASCTSMYDVYSPCSLFTTTVCKIFKKHVSLMFEVLSHGLPFFHALPSSHHLHHLVLITPLKLCLKAPSLPLTCCSLCEENINRSPTLLLWFNWGTIEWLRLKNLQLVLLRKIISVWFAQPLCFAVVQM